MDCLLVRTLNSFGMFFFFFCFCTQRDAVGFFYVIIYILVI